MKKISVLLVLIVAPFTAHSAICGSLAAVRNRVEILRVKKDSAKQGELVRNAIVGTNFMPVECDDVIQTGPDGSAKLILGNDKITLAPDSRIEIAAHSGAEAKPKVDLLNLTYGKMRGLIQKRPNVGENGQGAFRVKTFSAVAGVRGTDLYVGYNPNMGITDQAVIEGKVEVTQAGTKQKVFVEGGQQVVVETTPAAMEEARVRAKTSSKPDEATPPSSAVSKEVKALKVVEIQEPVRQAMRMASAVVKNDKEFTSEKAVKVLGQPQTWTIEKEDVPSNLKGVENEF